MEIFISILPEKYDALFIQTDSLGSGFNTRSVDSIDKLGGSSRCDIVDCKIAAFFPASKSDAFDLTVFCYLQ